MKKNARNYFVCLNMKSLYIIIMIFLIAGCSKSRTENNTITVQNNKLIYGIDVSNHQGKIDWKEVKTWNDNKIYFVYIKATEGATYRDKMYDINIKGAKSNNILVGSYHYFRTTSSVQKQFENFKNTVAKNKQDLIPLVDVEEMNEWNSEKFNKNFKEFLNLVESHFGSKPMIYAVNSFYNKNLSKKYKIYKFMIGRYGENEPFMKDKHEWFIWQFSESGNIKGINKKVDINIINSKYNMSDLLLNKK